VPLLHPLRRPVGDAHADGGEAGLEGPLGPFRQLSVRHFAWVEQDLEPVAAERRADELKQGRVLGYRQQLTLAERPTRRAKLNPTAMI
jgi:hypothetical protein